MTAIIKISVKSTKQDAYAYAEELKQKGYAVTIEEAQTIVIEANDSVITNDGAGVFLIIGKK